MPPSARPWEPEFIRLWQAGATQAAIAQALAIPVGSVKSRAHALAAQGKIQPRLRGGAYPRRQRQEQAAEIQAAPEDVSAMHPPVQTVQTVQRSVYALHGAEQKNLPPEDLKSERWNIDMPRWLAAEEP